LLERKQDRKTALLTNNLNTRQSASFRAAKSGARATSLLRGGTDKQWHAIKASAEDAAREVGNAMTSIKSDIEFGKYDSYKQHKDDFVGAIKRRIEQGKDEVNKKLDDITENVINEISALPEAQQDAAANAFSDAMDCVSSTFDSLVSAFKNVMGNISSLMNGNFDILENGCLDVKHAVDKALTDIGIIFGSWDFLLK
jgi:gas vesicle protein